MRKIVLISGASSGIGTSSAYKFASCGYDVIITYLNSEKEALKIKEDIINKYNVSVCIYMLDIGNEENVKEVYNDVKDKYGRIDVLVNNASICNDTMYEDKTKDNFMKILEVNLVGTFLMCKYFRNIIDKGSIINVSSANGIDTNYVEGLDYDASKAGVINLSRNLALEYSPNVRVNTVCPGWVNTRMNKDLDYEFIKEEEKKIMLGRFAESNEIANVIYFLASDDASYINNSVIRVDGGIKN